MASSNSPSSNWTYVSNGNNNSMVGMLWFYRANVLKGLVLFLFLSNFLYFSVRYVELTNYVRRLEADKALCANPTVRNLQEAKSDGEPPQLNYSQKKYYPYVFNEPEKCKDKSAEPLPVFLLIVVKSTIGQFDRRRSIRMTWGNESNIEGIVMRRIFLLAKGDDEKKQILLKKEVEEFHDIIQGDFHDSFRNLTIKDIMFMNWMTIYCPQTKFIFKGDDDVFVNINNIVDFLVSLPPQKAKNLFAGSVLYPSPRITNPKSKYYVSTNLWNEKYYPPYVSGGGFVMSSLVSKKIFEMTKVTPIIPIDDAFLGVCMKKLNMAPQNHKGFKSWGVNRPKDICIYREIMTLHKLNSEEMIEMWKKLYDEKADFSSCATVFKVTKDKNNKPVVL